LQGREAGPQSPSGSCMPPVEKHTIGTQTLGTCIAPEALPTRPTPQKTRQTSHRPVILKTCKLAVSEFAETPKPTLSWLVGKLLVQVNPRGKGCCPWHISLQALRKHLSHMTASECNQDFHVVDDWQCNNCFALQEFDTDETSQVCSLCLLEPIEPDPAQLADPGSPRSSCAGDTESY